MNESTAKELTGDLFDAHKKLLDETWVLWREHCKLNKVIGQEKFSRISIVTMTHIAAVTAVDVGMNKQQFLQTCEANYDAAVRRAPRWG